MQNLAIDVAKQKLVGEI